ncbi:hypothetical protein [Celeribacter arenosi]|uniref:Ca2+-binding protein, RTX toxin-related n=1 Tax=Celeribacter arenosi TaxID=792649 RepID=A0ABP7JZA7_9RHOB
MVSFLYGSKYGASDDILFEGISDLQTVEVNGVTYLYAVNTAHDLVASFSLSADFNTLTHINDRSVTSYNGDVSGMAIADLDGTLVLAPTGSTSLSFGFYVLRADGGIGGYHRTLDNAPAFTTLAFSETATGSSLAIGVLRDSDEIGVYRTDTGTSLTQIGSLPATGLADSTITTFTQGGQTYVALASRVDNSVTLYRLSDDGTLLRTSEYGANYQLGLNTPVDMQTVTIGDQTYLLVAGQESDSLTVLGIDADGAMNLVDHAIGSTATRLHQLTVMEQIEVKGHHFVIVGGGADGLTLLEVLPDGHLITHGSIADTNAMTLDNVSALVVTEANGQINVFVASETEVGVTRLTIPTDTLGTLVTGTQAGETLIGSALSDTIFGAGGGDNLLGLSGDDILVDGTGADSMTGGAGADRFVFNADGKTDTITDFSITQDRLDLSAFPLLRSVDQLNIIPTATGARVTYGDETIEIHSDTGYPILPDQLRARIDLPLSHITEGASAPGEVFTGTTGNDILTGSGAGDLFEAWDGDDILVGMGGADSYVGGAGHDTVDFSWSQRGVTIDLLAAQLNTGDAFASHFDGIEAFITSDLADEFYGDDDANHVNLGDGSDIAEGRGGDDYLNGGRNNDLLRGGDGNDTLLGGHGRDTLYGDAGDDVLDGGTKDDVLHGGDGNDTLHGGSDDDIMYGDAGNDTFTGSNGVDFYDGGTGRDTVDYSEESEFVDVDLADGQGTDGAALGETLISIENLIGTAFADHLSGSSAANELHGGAGNDYLSGMEGDDVIYGDDGDDWIIGGTGSNILDGGAGMDTVDYSSAALRITLNLFVPDSNFGAAAGDTFSSIENVIGTTFDDVIIGSDNDNFIFGGAGDDRLFGRDGDDRFEYSAGADYINGGSGSDSMSYASANGAVRVWLADPVRNAGEAAGDELYSIENLEGTDFDDRLLGTDGANIMIDGSGDDVVYGYAGKDTFMWSNGADYLHGGSGTDTMDYSKATERAVVYLDEPERNGGSASGDTLILIEDLIGSAFDDVLVGTAGNNTFYGGAGNDRLCGYGGADTFISSEGADTIYGGGGRDHLTFADANTGIIIRLLETDRNSGAASGYELYSIEDITGTSFDDLILGDDVSNAIVDGAGNDHICGYGGNDFFFHSDGYDSYYGGDGSDTMSFLTATEGVTIWLGDNSLNAGAAAQDLFYSIENIDGTNFDDVIVGSNAANTVTGGDGNDTISTLGGRDVIDSGAGNDRLAGGGGTNTLTGGAGNDTFVFERGRDTVMDFDPAMDDLVFASSWASGNHATDIDILRASATDTDAGLIIDLGSLGVITLVGVTGFSSIEASISFA